MLSKRRGRTIIKFALIWTLIAAVFTAAYSTGLYMLYKDSIHGFKDEILISFNDWFHLSHIRKDKFLLNIQIEGNYQYFGKIEDDGSLTDVIRSDYDSFRVFSSDPLLPGLDHSRETVVEYYLTNDTDKQGKVVASSYETNWDDPILQTYEQHYLYCPEEVFNKIRTSQEKGIRLAKSATILGDLDSDPSGNDLINNIYRTWMEAVLWVSFYLSDINEDSAWNIGFIEDLNSDGAYIYRADVDMEAGKIHSGELIINGEKYTFPDNNLTDSNTALMIRLHKRPDSIFEKNKDLLRENFDASYLKSLKYQSNADMDGSDGSQMNKTGLERYTYDCKYEEGQLVVSGISKYDDGYYRYVYIIPYAGFLEAFTPDIAEVSLKVWLPGLIIVCIISLVVSRKRYG